MPRVQSLQGGMSSPVIEQLLEFLAHYVKTLGSAAGHARRHCLEPPSSLPRWSTGC
ncbi:MAG: hypothetical protein U0401_03330 [Anaerolineae bacterium]